jgi:hypothetical protein
MLPAFAVVTGQSQIDAHAREHGTVYSGKFGRVADAKSGALLKTTRDFQKTVAKIF